MAELSTNALLLTSTTPDSPLKIPPPVQLVLPTKLLEITVSVPALHMPPPALYSELLPAMVLSSIVNVPPPLLLMPSPANSAELLTIALLLTNNVPELLMPPPLPRLLGVVIKDVGTTVSPPEIVTPEILTFSPELTVRTENGTALESRWIVRLAAPSRLDRDVVRQVRQRGREHDHTLDGELDDVLSAVSASACVMAPEAS